MDSAVPEPDPRLLALQLSTLKTDPTMKTEIEKLADRVKAETINRLRTVVKENKLSSEQAHFVMKRVLVALEDETYTREALLDDHPTGW